MADAERQLRRDDGRIFGWTPALAAHNDMREIMADGTVLTRMETEQRMPQPPSPDRVVQADDYKLSEDEKRAIAMELERRRQTQGAKTESAPVVKAEPETEASPTYSQPSESKKPELTPEKIESMTKMELAQYAAQHYGKALDTMKKAEALRTELWNLAHPEGGDGSNPTA